MWQISTVQAVQRVQSGKLSMLKASKKFKVPYGTLYNKCHALHTVGNCMGTAILTSSGFNGRGVIQM